MCEGQVVKNLGNSFDIRVGGLTYRESIPSQARQDSNPAFLE